MNSRTVLRLLGCALISVLLTRGSALALTLPPGYDFFSSPRGASAAFFGAQQGAFGTKFGFPSDPVQTIIQLEGRPLTSFPAGVPNAFGALALSGATTELGSLLAHGVIDPRGLAPVPLGVADTIVQRGGDAVLPGPGSSDTIPIEIVALSLVSTDPIRVTYGPFAPASFFDVFASLPPSQPQAQGTMTLTLGSGAEGTFDSVLPVRALLTFTSVDAGSFTFPAADTLTATGVPFNALVPEPSTVIGLLGGLGGLATFARRRQRHR